MGPFSLRRCQNRIINSVNNLFSAPGMDLELMGASVLAFGVVCYMARVAWIAMSHARRMELETMQALVLPDSAHGYDAPYCAG